MEWLIDWWDSLLDADHRERLYLIGSAVVAIVGWVIYWHKSKKDPNPPQVTGRDGESAVSQRDWNIRDALEWWEKVTGLNRGDGEVLDFFSDMRQAACDGNITVWGRANSEHRTPSQYTQPLQPIPAEHWTHAENEFDVMQYVNAENEDMIRDAATPPGTDSIPVGTRYVDLRLTSAEVKENVLPK